MINLQFPESMMNAVLNGVSILDVPRLYVKDLQEANEFLLTYGYNLQNRLEKERIWHYHKQAIQFLKEEILSKDELIPEELADSKLLGEIGQLLINVSIREDSDTKKWSCAILKIMHVFSHLDKSPFAQFSEEIQEQVFTDFKRHIWLGEGQAPFLGRAPGSEQISLHKYEFKYAKSLNSAAIKLLAKRSQSALNLFDYIGLRFITGNVFDSMRVLRFLINEHIISVSHIVPDEARNTIYPMNLFSKSIKELSQQAKSFDVKEIEEFLQNNFVQTQSDDKTKIEMNEKANSFSGKEYRAIKFITRKLVHIKKSDFEFSFYFPFEVQIMDHASYLQLLAGPSDHALYKQRQRAEARRRIFGN